MGGTVRHAKEHIYAMAFKLDSSREATPDQV